MADLNSLGDQLGWCITTQDYLNDLTRELSYVAQKYANSIDEIHHARYLADMLAELKISEVEFEEEIANLIKYIEDDHIAYIHRQSQTLQSQIALLIP